MSSRRNYLSQTELAEYADIIIEDTAEADDRITQAEEIIDAYVGTQDQFIEVNYNRTGLVTSATTNTLVDTSLYSALNKLDDDYFERCEVEIVKGTGSGQIRSIASSSKADGSITVVNNWTTAPDATSYYVIRQLAKFPRKKDVFFYSPTKRYSKQVPDAVKRATAAQVQYMITQGDEFFAGDSTLKQAEQIGKYSYSMGNGSIAADRVIAPKAKLYLRGFANRTGVLMSENPTCL